MDFANWNGEFESNIGLQTIYIMLPMYKKTYHQKLAGTSSSILLQRNIILHSTSKLFIENQCVCVCVEPF